MARFLPLLLILSVSMSGQSVLRTPVSQTQESCLGGDCERDSQDGGSHASPASSTKRPPTLRTGTPDPFGDELPERAMLAERASGATDRQPGPPEPRTEFQQLVESSTGKLLPIFGTHFFDRVPSTFAPVDKVPAQATYVIGAGDELLIRIWGSIEMDGRVIVDRNGQIVLPRVGVVVVAGLRYSQLEEFLRAKIARQFTGFDLNVTLGRMRTIQVFLLGNVRRPGSYTVSSFSTMVNALLASGGPNSTGSMRDIQLKRAGATVARLDLYDLIVSGDKSKDATLDSGDVIYIPPVGPLVALTGSVNTDAIFELRGETRLEDALRYAGGLNSVAGSKRVLIESVADRQGRAVGEHNLAESLGEELHDGDLVRVFPVSPRFENAVTLRGAAAQPGRYPWHPGMKVTDLIPSREVLITRDYWNNQNALGVEASNLFERPKEAVAPTDFERNPSDINWTYALVSRLTADLTTQLLPFDLGEAIDHPDLPANLPLQAGDVITIFSQADLPVSVERRTRYVTVAGEVNAPGVYEVEPDATLRDIVATAGGVTSHSYLYAADLRRESVRREQAEKLKDTVSRLRTELLVRTAGVDTNATADEASRRQAELARAQAYLQELSNVQPTGRVVLNVSEAASDAQALPALRLEDKDVLMIPARGGTIEVIGAVNNNNALIYEPEATVADYVGKAGGTTREADRSRMFVIRADGSVLSRQSHSHLLGGRLESFRLMPGDAIVVPNRLQFPSFLRGVRDWSQILSQFALGVAAAKVLNQ